MLATQVFENSKIPINNYNGRLSVISTGQIIRIRVQYVGTDQLTSPRSDYSYQWPFEFVPSYACQDISPKSQIEFLLHTCGFNISQLATILNVKRPTVYEWLDGKTPNPHNLERLEAIYSLFIVWNTEPRLRMGSYLFKNFDGQKSLYDNLIEKNINVELGKVLIAKIRNILLENRSTKINRDVMLKEKGFQPATDEQKTRTIRKLLRKA